MPRTSSRASRLPSKSVAHVEASRRCSTRRQQCSWSPESTLRCGRLRRRPASAWGTIYRHFPTRPELVVAVYRHQVEACADAGPQMLAESATPEAALRAWVALFVEFLVTKHGLAGALQGDSAGSDALHIYFVDRLVPVCDSLLAAALESVGTASRVDAYNVLKGIGNLCIGAGSDDRYKAEVLVQLFISGVLAREVR